MQAEGGGELLSHQRQQCCIGKVEQHHAQAEDDQRPGFEQDAGGTGRGRRRIVLSVEVSRPVVKAKISRGVMPTTRPGIAMRTASSLSFPRYNLATGF
jgi:hypothetical protein